jgi:hypothetical protein
LAENQEYPSFKSGGEAFDRAEIYKKIEPGNTSAITPEVGDAMREAGKVSKKAIDFYNEAFNKEIKALDPSYTPTGEGSVFYTFAYSDSGSDRRKIERKIEKGETVDGKEIVTMAKGSASTKVENAKTLKTGTVTQIVERVGAKEIKQMDAYEDVKNDFDSKVKSENVKFDKLLDKLQEIATIMDRPGPGVSTQDIYTPENNAIISAVAKILKEEGLTNESVNTTSEKYDNNIEALIKKLGTGKIEPSTEAKKEEAEKSKPTGVTEEKKLETKTESPVKTEEKPQVQQAPTTPKETRVESAKVEKSEAAAKTETALPASVPALEVSKQEIVKEETSTKKEENTPPTSSIESEMIKGSQEGVDFVKEIFGGFLGLKPEGATGDTGDTGDTGESKIESGGVDLAKSILKGMGRGEKKEGEKEGAQKTETKSSVASKEIPKPIESTKAAAAPVQVSKGESPKTVSATEKMQQKTGATPETFLKSTAIKETSTQKLSSPISVEKSSTENPGQTPISSGGEINTPQGKTESSATQEIMPGEEKKEAAPKEASSSSGSEGEESIGDLSSKMETMIGLLSNLNDVLSSPLLVTPTTKKFE